MIRPGPRNLITDIEGIRVGNARDVLARTGVTVVLPDDAIVAAADVRGGAPGTREIDVLDPTCLVDHVDAIVMSGGSAFGLDAASGAMTWLAAQGRGFPVRSARVPIVPAAIIFDLEMGGEDWGGVPPFRALGVEACETAARDFDLGNAGAGLGASAGALKGGLGSVSAISDDGLEVGALMVANPMGSVVMGDTPTFWAWAFERDGELGGQKPPAAALSDLDFHTAGGLAAQTTIGVVATSTALDVVQAKRIAMMAHDGFARAIRPVHTPFDGDTIFVLSTGKHPLTDPVPAAIARIGMMAADCVARAIARAVYEAETLGEFRSYRDTYGVTTGD
jgi:L-aminopeptidase/D-esterase-like protein